MDHCKRSELVSHLNIPLLIQRISRWSESDPRVNLEFERLCLVQSDLKSMIIDCFYTYILKSWSLTFNCQSFKPLIGFEWCRAFRLWSAAAQSLQRGSHQLSRPHTLPFWIVPFGIITKFVETSPEAIFWNCLSIFSKWRRNQISILVVSNNPSIRSSLWFVGCSFTRCDVVQVFRFCLIDVREFYLTALDFELELDDLNHQNMLPRIPAERRATHCKAMVFLFHSLL